MKRIKSDKGLMGPTHALFALTMGLLLTWVASDFMFNKVLGTKDLLVYITALIVIVGASLMPDLDAVNSTVINVLGIIGIVLSKVMRTFSVFIQSTIKGPYDKDADPHRGFWHTILSSFLMGFLITSLVNIKIPLYTTRNGSVFTLANAIVAFIIYISIQLTLASLLKSFHNKAKKNWGLRMVTTLGSLLLALSIVNFMPTGNNYSWVGGAVAFGWITHLLGDMLTVSGVPILFPLKHKGKRWWNYRFPFGLKAGGFVEKALLIPLFSLISILSLTKIIPLII